MHYSHLFCALCGAANPTQAAACFACGKPLQISSFAGHFMGYPQGVEAPQASLHLLHQRYRIISRVGKGGFGAVYKAADTQFGNRAVALKEMSQSGLKPQNATKAVDAFKREAILLAGLTHPNLPRIYDHFMDAGHWYLVMDFIEGQNLEQYLNTVKTGHLSLEKVLDIGLQLCKVLGYLHTRQPPIVFRDLKPNNIVLTPDGDIYLVDFGIARHFKPGQVRDTSIFGSPGYAAPEQYGRAQTTPSADIYSLGALLHQLLTGNDPLLNTPTTFDFPPLHLHGQAAGLEKLIMHMVAMDPGKRPTSMADIRHELHRIAAQK